MMIFISGILLFGVIALILFVPFGKRIDWRKNYRRQQNIALYQRQMQRHPTPELADELSRRLLEDEQIQAEHSLRIAKSAVLFSPVFSAVTWLMLCLIALGYYFSLQRFDYVRQGEQAFAAQQARLETATVAEKNDDYILTIQNKLRKDPNNSELWIELGQAYMLSNEFENALRSYANAEKISGTKPALLGLAATALYYQAGQKITPKVDELINAALAQDAKETSSLSLLASDAFLHADYAKAVQIWQQLLDTERDDLDRRSIIQSMQMAQRLAKTKQ
ncbi:c-type cytochrome biogenesis protein [Pasteurellaceae bacterium LIM206]|nr:c-type cytochrome biogenesis protein [Pasteurellaceae bacterium LIM206]